MSHACCCRDGQAPIHMAATRGDLSCLEFLVARGADIHAQTQHAKAISIAATTSIAATSGKRRHAQQQHSLGLSMDVRAPSHQKLQTRQCASCCRNVNRSLTIPAATSVRHSPSLNQHNTQQQPLQPSQPHQTTRIHSSSNQPSTKHSMQKQSQAQPPQECRHKRQTSSRSSTALTWFEHGHPRPEQPETPNTTHCHF